jgi:hypothetical protein
MQGTVNLLSMLDLQACATLSHHRPHTRNEQVSGSSPLVGFLEYASSEVVIVVGRLIREG